MEFIIDTINKGHEKQACIIKHYRPHLTSIVEPLLVVIEDILKITLYEILQTSNRNNIVLSSYINNIEKLVIVGNVPIK